MSEAIHPTAALLLESTKQLLKAEGAEGITIDQVLDESGISRGSLYHHFGDFPSLVDQALALIFLEIAEANQEQLLSSLSSGLTLDATLKAYEEALERVHGPVEAAENRSLRVQAIARAANRPEMRQALAEAQDSLTESIARIIEFGQRQGWFRGDFDARTIALLIQSADFGSVLDEFSGARVDRGEYRDLLMQIMTGFVMAPPS